MQISLLGCMRLIGADLNVKRLYQPVGVVAAIEFIGCVPSEIINVEGNVPIIRGICKSNPW